MRRVLTIMVLALLLSQACLAARSQVKAPLRLLEEDIRELEDRNLSVFRLYDILYDINSTVISDPGYNRSVRELTSLILSVHTLDKDIAAIDSAFDSSHMANISLDDLSQERLNLRRDIRSNNFEQARKEADIILDGIRARIKEAAYDGIPVHDVGAHADITGMLGEARQRMASHIYSLALSDDFPGAFDTLEDIRTIDSITEQALAILAEADRLSEEGIGMARVIDSIGQAAIFLNMSEPESAQGSLRQAEQAIIEMEKTREMMSAIGERIDLSSSRGVNVTMPRAIFEKGATEFWVENYEGAASLFEEADSQLFEIEQRELLFNAVAKSRVKSQAISFLKRNWLSLIASIAISCVILVYASRLASKKFHEIELWRLRKEERNLIDHKKRIQKDYFKYGSIDRKTYSAQLEKMDDRLCEVQERILRLDAMLGRVDQGKGDEGVRR